MKPDDLTLQVLTEIRDDARLFRAETRVGFADVGRKFEDVGRRFEEVGRRFEDVGQRFEEVGQKFDDVGRRIVDSEIRVATAITDLGGTLHEVRDELRASIDLRPRLERCEQEIAEIKTRLE